MFALVHAHFRDVIQIGSLLSGTSKAVDNSAQTFSIVSARFGALPYIRALSNQYMTSKLYSISADVETEDELYVSAGRLLHRYLLWNCLHPKSQFTDHFQVHESAVYTAVHCYVSIHHGPFCRWGRGTSTISTRLLLEILGSDRLSSSPLSVTRTTHTTTMQVS